MARFLARLPRWFVLLLGVALAALAVQALLTGAAESPSSYAFLRARIPRADQPGLYWALVLLYAAAAASLLALAWQRFRSRHDDARDPPPPAPRPRGLPRALAWLGVLLGAVLTGAGVAAHFLFDPIIGVPFVALLCGGGLLVGLTCAGYLATGRLQ